MIIGFPGVILVVTHGEIEVLSGGETLGVLLALTSADMGDILASHH